MIRQKGWTLIEMMVALALFSVVAASLYSVFQTGLATWRTSQNDSGQQQHQRAFVRVFSRDLINAVAYDGDWRFEGASDRLVFMTVESGEEGIRRLRRVSYRYDRARHQLIRQSAGTENGFDVRRAPEFAILRSVGAFEFSFARTATFTGQDVPFDTGWQKLSGIPVGVRVRSDRMETVFWAPMGAWTE